MEKEILKCKICGKEVKVKNYDTSKASFYKCSKCRAGVMIDGNWKNIKEQ